MALTAKQFYEAYHEARDAEVRIRANTMYGLVMDCLAEEMERWKEGRAPPSSCFSPKPAEEEHIVERVVARLCDEGFLATMQPARGEAFVVIAFPRRVELMGVE